MSNLLNLANDPTITPSLGNQAGEIDICLAQNQALSVEFNLQDQAGTPIPVDDYEAMLIIYDAADTATPPAPTSASTSLLTITSTQGEPPSPPTVATAATLHLYRSTLYLYIPVTAVNALFTPGAPGSAGHQIDIWPTASPEKRERLMVGRVTFTLSL